MYNRLQCLILLHQLFKNCVIRIKKYKVKHEGGGPEMRQSIIL